MGLSNVRVVSDGLPTGTMVYVDDKPIIGVLSIKWEMCDFRSVGVLTLEIEGADIDALALLVDGPEHVEG